MAQAAQGGAVTLEGVLSALVIWLAVAVLSLADVLVHATRRRR